MNIELRAARPSDREFIERTFFETQRWLIEELFGWRGDDIERAKFLESYSERDSCIIVAGGENVGWLAVARRPAEIELSQICVVPERQRCGIGATLVRELAAEAAASVVPFRLSTARINPARRLYERLGFLVTHEDRYKVYMEWLPVRFRALTRADFPDLIRWRRAPHAVQWFGIEPSNVGDAEKRYGRRIDGLEPTWMHVIEASGRSIGYMQHYLVADYPEYLAPIGDDEAAGVDFLIGDEAYVGRGLGPQIIAKYVKEVVVPRHAGVRRVVSSPDPENRRSIRALEKAGFRQVRTMTVLGKPERLCVLDLPDQRSAEPTSSS